jgi:hypothetical protein
MTGHQYDLQRSINDFNKRKEKLELDAKNGNLTQEQYNDAVEGLSSEAQRLDIAAKNVAATQKRMNALAGVYVAEKAKSGGFFGNFTNAFVVAMDEVREPLSYIVPALGKDLSGEEEKKIATEAQIITPQQRQYYKDKGYNDEQIKNVFINNAQKNAIAANKRAIIETFGSDLTTEESKQNLGFVEQALVGVAASLPSMLTRAIPIVGQVAAFGSMANMSYNAINEEMLNDTDFETTSEAERAVVAVPYALVMGALENVGLKNMTAGKAGVAGRFILSRVAKLIPKGASREIAENIINSEVKNIFAKGGIKIVRGTLAEFETGLYQAAALDYGLKALYNELDPLDLKLTSEGGVTGGSLTGGELFATPDTKAGVAMAILEGGVAEAIGGFAMSTVMTGAQGLINGKISLYNEEDLKFFEDFSSDQEFKKLIVSNLKTEMLNGTMTKGEAQSALNDIDLVEGVFNSIDENISDEAKIIAFNLINERNRLEKEIVGKDPALSKEKNDRIKDINDKLETLPLQVLIVNNIERATELETALKQKENKAGTVTIDGKKIPRVEAQAELDKINQKVLDAERKQEAGQVPVQPTTTVGEEVVQGEPTTEPQVLTEEGKAEEINSFMETEKSFLKNNLSTAKKNLEDATSEEDRSYYEEAVNRREKELELFNSNPIEYVKSKLEEFSEKDENGELYTPFSYNMYKDMYDRLSSEATTEVKAEKVAPQTLLEELQLLAKEQAKAPKAKRGKGKTTRVPKEPKVETPVVKKESYEAKSVIVRAIGNARGEVGEYSVSISKDGKTAKVRLKKMGSYEATGGGKAETNLEIKTDENKKRFVTTKNKTKVYIDEAITPAKVETTKAKATTKAKVETDKLNSEEKQYALESGIPEEVKKIFTELKGTKATDDSGAPLLVYHGGVKFDDFNPSQNKEDKGIYFTDNEEFALYFAHQAELYERDKRGDDYSDIPEDLLETGEPFPEKYFKYAKVHKAYLDMKNPTIVDAIDAKSIPKNYQPNTDGFIAKSTGDFGYRGGQYVVFDPKQIKKVPEVSSKTQTDTTVNTTETAKEKADKAAAKEEAKSASVVKKEEAPAPAKESTDDLMGAIDSIKEEIDEITKDIKDLKTEARKEVNKIEEEKLETTNKSKLEDLNDEITVIEDDLEKALIEPQKELDGKIKELKEEVKKIEELDAKNPENKKTLLSYLDAAIKTLNGLNKLSYVKLDLGVTVGTLKLILKGIRAGVIAGNTISASIKAMASQYRGKHKNKKITIAEFTKEIEEYITRAKH